MYFLKIYLISCVFFALLCIAPAYSQASLTVTPREIVKRDLQANYFIEIRYPEILVNEDEIHYGLGFPIQEISFGAMRNFIAKAERNTNPGQASRLTLDYQITYQSNKLISIFFTEKSQLAGGAAQRSNQYAITFDLENNAVVNLEQLFAKGKWQEILSRANDAQVWDCIEKHVKKEAFCLNKQGLLLLVAHVHSSCPSEIVVPWHKIGKSVTLPLVQREFDLR